VLEQVILTHIDTIKRFNLADIKTLFKKQHRELLSGMILFDRSGMTDLND